MKRPYVARCHACGSLAAVTAVTSALPMVVMANTSSVNFDMRRQAVSLTGILNVSDHTGQVIRGDSARMLVNAFSYRENLPTSSVSVFAGMPSIYLDTIYVRIAASQGWMTGSLGGLFRPEEHITYKDAVKMALTMLGYSDENFTGGSASSHISGFNHLELNEEVDRRPEEVLNQTDCMNIPHNLLRAKKKDSSGIYGAALDCEFNSDGEISPITILDDERKDPILMREGFGVIQSVPLGSENANVFLNGIASILETVKASQQDMGFAVVCYSVRSRTTWAYITRGWDDDDLEGNNAYVLLKGEVRNIYCKSTDVMISISIRLEIDDDNPDGGFGEGGIDEDGYLTISLNSSEFQYLFSIYDGIGVGDKVVMVCNKSDSSYMAVDAIEY